MPTYRFLCPKGHETLEWHSIHEDTPKQVPCGKCSRVAQFAFSSPAIAADALPNKMHGVRAINARDKRWDRDMPAYKRLRQDGLQPRGIDGSADLETRAEAPLEIEMGKKLGKEADVRRAQEVASELMGQDVTKTGADLGKTLRGEAA